ncbi:MAG TPA: FkbM family methyltransferase [Deltaproteobacteria bacterium]|nr:FkbM family methyltransferase [Deltaproteobacteria bacterium]
MDMLRLFPELEKEGIDFIDLGCSGTLDAKWHALFPLLNYVGFDPNTTECQRLSALPSSYRHTRYMPYAISGEIKRAVMHVTRSPHCSSLLSPRHTWLRRFTYHALFEEVTETDVDCVTLDHLNTREHLRADVIKLDTQGLELPILRAAATILPQTFCVETETGYVENYIGETVSSDMDDFMRKNGFMLFDVTIHRVGRDNHYAELSRKQPLWCESLWLRDYLSQESWGIPVPVPDRHQACKALLICKVLGFADYGYELSEYFNDQGLISDQEKALLADPRTWDNKLSLAFDLGVTLFRLLPGPWRRKLLPVLQRSIGKPHLLRGLIDRTPVKGS